MKKQDLYRAVGKMILNSDNKIDTNLDVDEVNGKRIDNNKILSYRSIVQKKLAGIYFKGAVYDDEINDE